MIVDSHSHFGCDYYCGNILLSNYIDYCIRTGIKIGLVMPTPWPVIDNKVALLWEHENFKKINHFQFNLKTGEKIRIEKNPYEKVNFCQYYELQSVSKQDVELFFIPLIHGSLDKVDYLESLLSMDDIIAVKMHGFGSGFSPKDITKDVIEVVKANNVPIIIHTSVYNYDYGYGADTKYWRNESHPLKWIKFLLENNLPGVINHGACLNYEAIQLINENDKIMMGIGPDLDINSDYFKVDIDCELYKTVDYLKHIKSLVKYNKLLFDIDYNWNVNPEDGKIDYNPILRIRDNWNEEEFNSLTYNNALSFFPKLKKKLSKKRL